MERSLEQILAILEAADSWDDISGDDFNLIYELAKGDWHA